MKIERTGDYDISFVPQARIVIITAATMELVQKMIMRINIRAGSRILFTPIDASSVPGKLIMFVNPCYDYDDVCRFTKELVTESMLPYGCMEFIENLNMDGI